MRETAAETTTGAPLFPAGLAVDLIGQRAGGEGEWVWCVNPADLRTVGRYLHRQRGAALVDMIGSDERELDGYFRLRYIFSLPAASDGVGRGTLLTVEVAIDPATGGFPSLTPDVPAAHWYEREVKDLFGLTPVGHPDPRRLVLHRGWPKGYYPLRRDAVPVRDRIRPGGDLRFPPVEGEGVMEVPVGPIHAGIIEPGHFRFSVVGEAILHLEAQLFYTHKGTEKLAEGKSWEEGLVLAERICGTCSFSHGVAFAQAVERLAGVQPPRLARYVRTLFLEMERLANHLGDIGNIAAGVGCAPGASHGARLRETVMQWNDELAGHRFLRGLSALGGVTRSPAGEARRELRRRLDGLEGDFGELVDILLSQEVFRDRLLRTGTLTREAAWDLGVVGPAARASGVDRDLRRDFPYAAYDELEVPVPTYTWGDVMARFQVRVDEVHASCGLIRRLLDQWPENEPALTVPVPAVEPYRQALGYTESPRGENLHWLMSGPDNRIFRYRVRSASYPNWPAVAHAVRGNIIPDFPLINKSFELCYACLDR